MTYFAQAFETKPIQTAVVTKRLKHTDKSKRTDFAMISLEI